MGPLASSKGLGWTATREAHQSSHVGLSLTLSPLCPPWLHGKTEGLTGSSRHRPAGGICGQRPAQGQAGTGERSFVHKLPCESESALGLTQKEVPCSRAVRRPLCPCRSIWKTPRLSNVPRSHGQSLEGQGVDRCSRSPQVPPRRQALTPTAPRKGPRKQTSLSFHFAERKPLKTAFNQTVHRNYAQCFWGHPGAQAQAP